VRTDVGLREQYREALTHLRAGRRTEFERLREGLEQYALYPYLDYAVHQQRLDRLKKEEVGAFRQRWRDTPVADRLYLAWLDRLAERDDWRTYVDAFEPGQDAARTCYYLRGLLRQGEAQLAFDQVAPLWLVPYSQHKRCDPVFKAWIDAGRLTERLVWQRLALSLEANERTLATYLTRLLTGPRHREALLFLRVNRNPGTVTQHSLFRRDSSRIRTIVGHGLRRLARTDPEAAAEAWLRFEDELAFEPGTARRIDQEVTRLLARKGTLIDVPDLSPTADGRHFDTAEALVVAAIQHGAYERAIRWIDTIDPDRDGDPRWRYWLGRALLGSPTTLAAGRDVLAALATERNYYGFLAAERIGREPVLNAVEPDVAESARARLDREPGFARLRELYALDDRLNARREWRMVAPRLDAELSVAAVVAIAEMGWTDLAVIAAGDAGMTDYLSIRFPRPWPRQYARAAKATALPASFLYGVTRQESAFWESAVSTAGALGLMQLMPPTAARTARALGLRSPSRSQLLTAAVNIPLGSNHLAALVKRYGGNRALAAAAYNAGEHRVDRWLDERPFVAIDLWVDMIPFLETRNYVKGVLAFSYIYGQLLDDPQPFLTERERGSGFAIDHSTSITSSALNGQSSSLPSIFSTGMRVP